MKSGDKFGKVVSLFVVVAMMFSALGISSFVAVEAKQTIAPEIADAEEPALPVLGVTNLVAYGPAIYLDQNNRLTISIANEGEAMALKATAKIFDVVPRQSEELITTLNLGALRPGMEKSRFVDWTPTVLGIHYIRVEMNCEYLTRNSPAEVVESPPTVLSVGFPVSPYLGPPEEWGPGRQYPSIIDPDDEEYNPGGIRYRENVEIHVFGNLEILPEATLQFGEGVILVMIQDELPTIRHDINIHSDGKFLIDSPSKTTTITKSSGEPATHTYPFLNSGTVDFLGADVLYTYGDKTDLSQPGGIQNVADSACSLTDCWLTDADTHSVYADGSELTLSGTYMYIGKGDSNAKTNKGNGISISGGGSTVLDGIWVYDNDGDNVHCVDADNVVIQNGAFIENADGNGVCLSNSDVTISNSFIDNNRGHGITCLNGAAPTISSCEIYDNDGAGIHSVESSSPKIDGNLIYRNYLGGIVSTLSTPSIKSNTIRYNMGDGISLDGCVANIESNQIVSNGNSIIFEDDFDSGLPEWTVSDAGCLWHVIDDTSATDPWFISHSSSHAWWFGDDETGTYETADPIGDNYFSSPPISLLGKQNAVLTFWSWYDTDTNIEGDLRFFNIINQATEEVFECQITEDPMNTWVLHTIDLSQFTDNGIRFEVWFSPNAEDNTHQGWYIDDVMVTTPFQDTTTSGISMKNARAIIPSNNLEQYAGLEYNLQMTQLTDSCARNVATAASGETDAFLYVKTPIPATPPPTDELICMFSFDSGMSWSDQIISASIDADITSYDIAVSNGAVHIAYVEGLWGLTSTTWKSPKLMYTRSVDFGRTWEEPILLGIGINPSIAVVDNHVYICYQSKGTNPLYFNGFEGRGVKIAVSHDAGDAWGTTEFIDSGFYEQSAPKVSAYGTDVDMVWTYRGHMESIGYMEISHTHSDDWGNSWDATTQPYNVIDLVDPSMDERYLDITTKDGYLNVVWSDLSLGTYNIALKQGYYDGSTWSWLSKTDLTTGDGDEIAPECVMDTQNALHVTWLVPLATEQTEIRYSRVDSGGVTQADEVLLVENGAFPSIAVGSQDTLLLAWESIDEFSQAYVKIAHNNIIGNNIAENGFGLRYESTGCLGRCGATLLSGNSIINNGLWGIYCSGITLLNEDALIDDNDLSSVPNQVGLFKQDWEVRVTVYDEYDTPMNSAKTFLYDVRGVRQGVGATDTIGTTPIMLMPSYVVQTDGTIDYSPYEIHAQPGTCPAVWLTHDQTLIEIDENMEVDIYLYQDPEYEPSAMDSDGNGVFDSDEVNNGFDPFIPDPDQDSDGDGMSDYYEVTVGVQNGGWQDQNAYNERYAVLFVGGARIGSNHARYWNQLVDMYDMLYSKYGYKDENIFVLYADGNLPNPGNCYQFYLCKEISSHASIIDYSTTNSSFTWFFNEYLPSIVGPNDFLFTWTYDHGGGVGGEDDSDDVASRGATLVGWDEYILDVNYAIPDVLFLHWYQDISCVRHTMVMGQCFSGGFRDVFADADQEGIITNPFLIMTSCGFYESSHSDSDKGFLYHFRVSANPLWMNPCDGRGFYKIGKLSLITSDISGNGFISMSEAWGYALVNNDYILIDGPQYYESESGLGSTTYL